jgi:hypothetical protein
VASTTKSHGTGARTCDQPQAGYSSDRLQSPRISLRRRLLLDSGLLPGPGQSYEEAILPAHDGSFGLSDRILLRDGNRSDVIFVSKFDTLWNSSTSIPHLAEEGSETVLVEDASDLAHPIPNSLLYAKGINSVMAVVGFWNDYFWLCGATNNFDCEFS